MSTPFSYFDLIDAFAQPGCAVCTLLLRDAKRFLDSLLYEFTNDWGVQRDFRASRGLCNEHGWQLMLRRGSVLNITVLYAAALDEVLEVIEGRPGEKAASNWLARLLGADSATNASALADNLEAQKPCPACETLNEGEKSYILTLSQHLADARFAEAYRASDGLCLPHFRMALRQTQRTENLRLLLGIQTAIWEKLLADLETLKDKYDANREDIELGDAGDSWRRAIRLIAGEKGIFGVSPR